GSPLFSAICTVVAGGSVAWMAANVGDGPPIFLLKGSVAAGVTWATARSFDLAPPLAGDRKRFQSVAWRLQSHTMFEHVLPPEMREFIGRQETAITFRSTQPPATDEQLTARVTLPSFHGTAAYFTGGLVVDTKQSKLLDLSPVQGFSPLSRVRTAEGHWAFGAQYSLMSRLRIGGMITFYPEPPVYQKDVHEERLFGHAVAATADVILLPHDPLLRPNVWQYNRFEVSVGSGITYNSFTIDGLRNTGTMYPETATLYSAKRNSMGALIHAAVAYYMIQNYSVRIGLEHQWIASMMTPPAGEFLQFQEYATAPHAIAPSASGIFLGAEFHF
ncbi:MAG: hypothetical protein ABI876_02265, partial [Bacteroidota bacterium]